MTSRVLARRSCRCGHTEARPAQPWGWEQGGRDGILPRARGAPYARPHQLGVGGSQGRGRAIPTILYVTFGRYDPDGPWSSRRSWPHTRSPGGSRALPLGGGCRPVWVLGFPQSSATTPRPGCFEQGCRCLDVKRPQPLTSLTRCASASARLGACSAVRGIFSHPDEEGRRFDRPLARLQVLLEHLSANGEDLGEVARRGVALVAERAGARV